MTSEGHRRATGRTTAQIEQVERYAAHNYHPLPVVLCHGEGAWVTDVEGNRYLDCLAGYSALNFGHGHPRLVARAREQLSRLTLTSRAFFNDQLGPFVEALADLTGKDMILPMNTGAEAVETAAQGGPEVGLPGQGRARRVRPRSSSWRATSTAARRPSSASPTTRSLATTTGRTRPASAPSPSATPRRCGRRWTTRPSPSSSSRCRGREASSSRPRGTCARCGRSVTRPASLMVADEIQSGLARTGRTFACDHEDVVPDIYVLGKALGGGLYPVSAIAANREVLGVITPGSHGSTFGGNPLAAAIGHEVVTMLAEGEFQRRAAHLGGVLEERLTPLVREPVGEAWPAGDPRARALGGPRHRARRPERPRAVRAADAPRHPRQGHPRLDDPHRATDRRHRGRDRPARRRHRRRPRQP